MNGNINKNYNYNIENNLNENNFQHPFDFNEDYNNANVNNNNINNFNSNENEKINNKEFNNIINRFERINESKQNFFQSFEFYTNKNILILFIFFIILDLIFILINIISKTKLYFKILTIIIAVLIIIFLFIPYGIIISYNNLNKKILIHKKCILDCICYNNYNNYFDIQNIKIFLLQKIEGCCILKYDILYTLKNKTNHNLLCSIQNEFCQNQKFENILGNSIEQMNKWIYL